MRNNSLQAVLSVFFWMLVASGCGADRGQRAQEPRRADPFALSAEEQSEDRSGSATGSSDESKTKRAAPAPFPSDLPWAKTYRQHAVVSGHPLASQAGLEVLEKGGSAADALIASMLAMGVVSPVSSGLGGGGFALYFDAKSGSTRFLDFRETAPAKATPTMFLEKKGAKRELGKEPSRFGGRSSGIPGEAAGMHELATRFGKAKREVIFAPAIRYASEGAPVSHHMEKFSHLFGAHMLEDKTLASWFEKGKQHLVEGQLLKQPKLSKTLEQLRDKGYLAFYRGALARAILRANRKQKGLFRKADLSGYKVVERTPIDVAAFGYRFTTAPTPSAGGYILASSLRFLAGLRTQHGSAQTRKAQAKKAQRSTPLKSRNLASWDRDLWNHTLIESWKGPYLDRIAYFGDTDKVQVPLDALNDSARIAARVAAFRRNEAQEPQAFAFPIPDEKASKLEPPNDSGTSHICVIDKDGNVAAATTTVNMPFGARYSAAGFIMNDEMDDFSRPDRAANAYGIIEGDRNLPGPGKRPLSSMSPTIVFRDGKPVLCIGGGAGGTRIPTALQQVAVRHLVRGENLAAATAAPRVHHQGIPAVVLTENDAPLAEARQRALRERKHKLEAIRFIASIQSIRIHRDKDGAVARLEAASDPRKGGLPAGR